LSESDEGLNDSGKGSIDSNEGLNNSDEGLNALYKGLNNSDEGLNGSDKGLNDSNKGSNGSDEGLNGLNNGLNGPDPAVPVRPNSPDKDACGDGGVVSPPPEDSEAVTCHCPLIGSNDNEYGLTHQREESG
jgi:hypothetical protein